MGLAAAIRDFGVHLIWERLTLSEATGSAESLQGILRVARQLSRSFDLKEALEQIVDSGCEVLRAGRASVFLFDPARNELYGEATSSRDEIRFPADQGIAGQCLTEGSMIRVNDCYADPRFNRKVDEQTGYRSQALLSIPLIGIEQEPVGVMQLLNPERGHSMSRTRSAPGKDTKVSELPV